MLWNQFSNEAKLAESVPTFKKLIRKWLGLKKMYIFTVLNFHLFYHYHYYYYRYYLLLLLLSSLLNISVLKSSNSSSNRKTYYAGYYVDKDTHTEKLLQFSLIFYIVIRLEFNLDVISKQLEWSPVPYLRKLFRFA